MQPLFKSLKQVVPYLSAYDQPDVAEGALDPLGLYPISDALTVNTLCPGIRERQKHPGFLLPIAIGARITDELTKEYSDEVDLSPMQVFEWYVVHSLVESYKDTDSRRLTGLPGKDKVATALYDSGCVAPGNYLKTPSVFGFYGVYKLLARKLNILHEDLLGLEGDRLISAWQYDERSSIGDVNAYYALTLDAIRYGLDNKKTRRNWKHLKSFAKPLVTNNPGTKVSSIIWELLTDDVAPLRSEYLHFLVNDGADVWVNSELGRSEKEVHSALIKKSTPEMKSILETIQCYEEFSRLLLDAFNHILFSASHAERAVSVSELAKLECVTKAIKKFPGLRSKLEEGLELHGLSGRFDVFLNLFANTGNCQEWVEALLDHHIKNQQGKPPNGKMPFFDRLDNGSVITRAGYRRNKSPDQLESYVHAYRLSSLWSFAMDLRKV